MKEILITSSVMILAVMILRFLFRTKVNRRLVYGVWLLVALRLLVPIQFGQLDFSVLTQAKPVTDAITDIAQRPVSGPSREELYQDALRQEISQGAPVFIPEVQDRVDTEIQQSGRPAPEVYEEFLETNRSEEILLPEVSQKIEVTVTEKAAPNWGQIALWVWLAGSFGMAGWFLGVNISLRRSLRRSAADLMNYVTEATLISAMLRLDRVGVAASLYNMAMEAESLPQLKRTGSLLWHMRVSNALGNRPPKEGDGEDYTSLFAALDEMGYEGRITMEAPCPNFEKDASEALARLKNAAK
jgi:hypothetical protein